MSEGTHRTATQDHDSDERSKSLRRSWKSSGPVAKLTVVFAGMAALSTTVYAFVAAGQWWSMRGQLRAMEQDQRPWVGLMGSNHITSAIQTGSPIRISLDFQNVGKSPALDLVSVNHFSTHPVAAPLPAFDDCADKDASQPVTLMPNAMTNVKIETDVPGSAGVPILVDDAGMALLNNGQVELFIYGCIRYKDTRRNSHRTDYCLKYIPASVKGGAGNSFAACASHNFAD